jgi:dCMP deaminase
MIHKPPTELGLLRFAAIEAASKSEDTSTQNAAILVRPDDFVFSAANAFPPGIQKRPERLVRPEKYTYIEHAERAVIYRAASSGWPTGGTTMYALWFACPDCARAIISAGIFEVVGHARTRQETPPRWLEAVEDGERMLREAGVGMRWLSGKLGVTIRFNGKELPL